MLIRIIEIDQFGAATMCWLKDGPMFFVHAQQTQNIFIQCWTSVFDAGPTLYKCYTNVFCLLGSGLYLTNQDRVINPSLRNRINKARKGRRRVGVLIGICLGRSRRLQDHCPLIQAGGCWWHLFALHGFLALGLIKYSAIRGSSHSSWFHQSYTQLTLWSLRLFVCGKRWFGIIFKILIRYNKDAKLRFLFNDDAIFIDGAIYYVPKHTLKLLI